MLASLASARFTIQAYVRRILPWLAFVLAALFLALLPRAIADYTCSSSPCSTGGQDMSCVCDGNFGEVSCCNDSCSQNCSGGCTSDGVRCTCWDPCDNSFYTYAWYCS